MKKSYLVKIALKYAPQQEVRLSANAAELAAFINILKKSSEVSMIASIAETITIPNLTILNKVDQKVING